MKYYSGKMAWRIFSWFPPAASFFPLRALSLCTSIKMALNRVQRHGEILSAKSCGMCVSDTAHVKCIEIFQFKCICLSLGLRVECEPEPDCQHYPVRGLQCSAGMRSECSFSRMSWSYYARPRWMRGGDHWLSLHFLHINNVIQASDEEGMACD